MAIFTQQKFLSIPVNYRANIDEALVNNDNLENNIRSKHLEHKTLYQQYILNILFDASIFTLDLCFQLANDGETIAWEATAPSLMAYDFEKQAENILNPLLQIFPRGTTSVAGKRSKIGITTFYAMLAKNFSTISFSISEKKEIILCLREESFYTPAQQKQALLRVFSSFGAWLDNGSLEKQIDALLAEFQAGAFQDTLNIEKKEASETEFFKNKAGDYGSLANYHYYRNTISEQICEENRSLFEECFDIQMIAFYRNCMMQENSPTQLMPVLYGKQGVGKTHSISAPFLWLAKEIANNDMYYSGNMEAVRDKSERHVIFMSKFCLFDDLTSSQSKKVVGELKKLLSDKVFSKERKYYDEKINYDARCIFFGTTNIQSWLPDTENRRFPTFEILGKIRHRKDFDFSVFWDGIKCLGEERKDINLCDWVEQLTPRLLAMHDGNSELVMDEVAIIVEGISGDNILEDNEGDRVIIPRKTLYQLAGKMQNSKNQIKMYIDEHFIDNEYRIKGTKFRGIGVVLQKESELLQTILSKRLPAIFVHEDRIFTTAEYSEKLRHNATIIKDFF